MDIAKIIRKKIDEINYNKELWSPGYLSEVCIELSSLHSSLTAEISQLENAYYRLEAAILLKGESAATAKILSRATPEYQAYHDVVMIERVLLEEIRSIKKYVSLRQNEYETSVNN